VTIGRLPEPIPVRRGRAGAGLLAHFLVAKYCDHLPLHRKAEIYARQDIDLSRSTLADMVGQTARLVRPLGRHQPRSKSETRQCDRRGGESHHEGPVRTPSRK
jgi:transposase